MAAALAKHQASKARAADVAALAAADDDDDDDDDEGGAGGHGGLSDSSEVERRFGDYMAQKGLLNELDGGLSAISREQVRCLASTASGRVA
jgi:hypothetical protein